MIRHVYIRIKPPMGGIYMTVPHRTSIMEIQRILQRKKSWILDNHKRMHSIRMPPTLACTAGNTFNLWGSVYQFRFIHGRDRYSIEVDDQYLVVNIPGYELNWGRVNLILHRWCLNQLINAIEYFIDLWSAILGVVVLSYQVRKMKRRWGTCYWSRGRIIINYRLVHGRKELLEYVIVHEMLHLIEHSHTNIFYTRMREFFPNWMELEADLAILSRCL
ncbi:SprT family zinc-dependent metalloprotease [Entomospira nematocerorum]|nr:SprT family zinc-dependent metalloprotease [Entomospira nematocera]WDI34523.1 SprT family zinc-dependent metalloprotease [Entomospira nematocera]